MNINTNSINSATFYLKLRSIATSNIVEFILQAKNWTEKQMAKKVGVSQSYISQLRKKDWKEIGIATQARIARKCGVDYELPKFGFMK